MSNTMFFSRLLNIGLLVLIATMLTKIPVVRSMLLGENNLIGSRAALAVIFGLVSIVSTYTGVRAQGEMCIRDRPHPLPTPRPSQWRSGSWYRSYRSISHH